MCHPMFTDPEEYSLMTSGDLRLRTEKIRIIELIDHETKYSTNFYPTVILLAGSYLSR